MSREEEEADFAQLVRDFAATLPGRLDALRKALGDADVEALRFVVHKLAGVAGSFGFPVLSDVSGRIDDWMHAKNPTSVEDLRQLARFAALLDQVLMATIADGREPDVGSNPLMAELISSS